MHEFDLEERTFQFALNAARFLRLLQKDFAAFEYAKQAIRAAGSVGANYIEANESLSDKDFLMRLKISRKETKEFIYWLRLIKESNAGEIPEGYDFLYNEAQELLKIFSAIINKKTAPSEDSD
ncbi:MAG: four helix bundle protein [Patescibacteria group bacterium]